jgi:MFS family permease
MNRDVLLLFGTRVVRMAAYGGLAVVLALYLGTVGFDAGQVGLLLTATLAGDAAVSLLLSVRADRDGRRRTLVIGALLMVLGAVVFVLSDQFVLLVAAAIVAVLSPTGNEVGPFLSVEQASLSEIVPPSRRTRVLAWYQLAGSLATATGALVAGVGVQALLDGGTEPVDAYRAVIIAYGLAGLSIGVLASRVSGAVEPPAPADPSVRRRLGLHRSGRIVAKLSALFALDAFAGGFVIQTIVALWFTLRWALDPAALGAVFFGTSVLAGLSGLVAARIAERFGLIATMVGTHLPSNILLILVPFMPTIQLAVAVLLARFAISQMDVPTRQSYTIAVVAPDERSAAAGLTGVARSAGAAVSPALATPLVAAPILAGGLPFVIAGTLKIAYDLLLWREFRAVKPPEERDDQTPTASTVTSVK